MYLQCRFQWTLFTSQDCCDLYLGWSFSSITTQCNPLGTMVNYIYTANHMINQIDLNTPA